MKKITYKPEPNLTTFKLGDRVRLTAEGLKESTRCNKGDIGEVLGITGPIVSVIWGNGLQCAAWHHTLLEHADAT